MTPRTPTTSPRLVGAFGFALAAAALSFAPSEAAAHGSHGKTTRLELGPKRDDAPPPGPRGRLAIDSPRLRLLRGEGSKYVAELEVRNVGDGPLRVLRVGLPPSERWPEAPPGLGVQALERDAPIPPGGSRRYEVGWRAEAARAEQLHATLQIDTDGAAPGATTFDPPGSVRLTADRRLGPARYLLSLVVLLPLLLPLLALATRRMPALGERVARRGGAAVAAIHAALSLWAFARFDRGLGRIDGNEGLQMIERGALGGLEYFVALDGLSAPLLAAVSLGGFAALAALRPSAGGTARTVAASGLLLTGASLFLVAQTPALAVAGFVLAAAAAFAAVHVASSRAGRHLAPALAVSTLGVAIAGHLLAHHAPSEQGALLATLPELVRDGLHVHDGHERWLGLPVAQAASAAALVAALPALGLLPLSGWIGALQRDAGPAVAALVSGTLGVLGGAWLVRVGLLVLPAEAAWLAPTATLVGLVTALLAALAAFADRRPSKLVGRLASTGGALVLLAVASRTPQGLQAAVVLLAVRGLALPLLLLTAGAFDQRLGPLDTGEGGVGSTAPRLAALWIVALVAASGAPGGAAFWGVLEGLFGVVARTPATGLLATAAVTLSVAAHLRGAVRSTRAPDPSWRLGERLAPHAGQVPDLGRAELGWAAPLALALVLLALLPRSVAATTDTLVLDAQPALDPPGPTQLG